MTKQEELFLKRIIKLDLTTPGAGRAALRQLTQIEHSQAFRQVVIAEINRQAQNKIITK